MARSVTEYRDMMLALLPQGDAWPRDPASHWSRLFTGFAEEFARIDAANEQLLSEMNPTTTVNLLPEWEADYGLPTDCTRSIAQTFIQRRNSLVSKWRLRGNQSKQFFIDTAAEFGFTITITEYSEDEPGPQDNYQGIPLTGDAWNYVWQINAPSTTLQRRVSGSRFGEPYAVFGNELLECVMREIAHDHRILFFAYI